MVTSDPVRLSTIVFATVGASLTPSSAISLSATGLPLRQASSCSDQQLGAGRLQPLAQRFRREPAEYHHVRRPQPRAGQHRDRKLGHHAHVDADHVALADSQGAQRRREPAHVLLQLGERDRPVVFVRRLGHEVVGDLVPSPCGHMPIEAIDRDVQAPVCKPCAVRGIPGQRVGRRGLPLQRVGGALEPEALEVGCGRVVHGRVGDHRLGDELRRRWERSLLIRQHIDIDLGRYIW